MKRLSRILVLGRGTAQRPSSPVGALKVIVILHVSLEHPAVLFRTGPRWMAVVPGLEQGYQENRDSQKHIRIGTPVLNSFQEISAQNS